MWKHQRGSRKERKIFIFIDLAKAYDTVRRAKLWQILYRRAGKDLRKRMLVKMMEELGGEDEIELEKGITFKAN